MEDKQDLKRLLLGLTITFIGMCSLQGEKVICCIDYNRVHILLSPIKKHCNLQHGPLMFDIMSWLMVCTHNVIPNVFGVEISSILNVAHIICENQCSFP